MCCLLWKSFRCPSLAKYRHCSISSSLTPLLSYTLQSSFIKLGTMQRCSKVLRFFRLSYHNCVKMKSSRGP
ncbi:hypothetical protein ATANTOWER_007209 [Ataeniobius toweri]|uniref:Uncharacterized protein n=1 Tax=Ataeniobius toweri TaxID=208326 RepID=A0ABU7CDF2_9TELE|nr:hypothetical protein [Ataeniobius toweri]